MLTTMTNYDNLGSNLTNYLLSQLFTITSMTTMNKALGLKPGTWPKRYVWLFDVHPHVGAYYPQITKSKDKSWKKTSSYNPGYPHDFLETPMYKDVEAKQSWRLSSTLILVQDEGCACDLRPFQTCSLGANSSRNSCLSPHWCFHSQSKKKQGCEGTTGCAVCVSMYISNLTQSNVIWLHPFNPI